MSPRLKEFIAMFKLNLDEALSNAKLLSLRKSVIQLGQRALIARSDQASADCRPVALVLRRAKP